MGEPTNTSPNLNKLHTASHCSKFSPLHQSKQASEDDCLWNDAYTHQKPSVWICHPSGSGVLAPRCRSSPPGCASSPGFSSWSFPALNASWPGWKPALYFSDPSGSENQTEQNRGDTCNIKPHLDLSLQFKDWTYRLDSHALQLYYKSLFNFRPNFFLDAAAVFLNSRICCMLLLWCWRGLMLSWLLLG